MRAIAPGSKSNRVNREWHPPCGCEGQGRVCPDSTRPTPSAQMRRSTDDAAQLREGQPRFGWGIRKPSSRTFRRLHRVGYLGAAFLLRIAQAASSYEQRAAVQIEASRSDARLDSSMRRVARLRSRIVDTRTTGVGRKRPVRFFRPTSSWMARSCRLASRIDALRAASERLSICLRIRHDLRKEDDRSFRAERRGHSFSTSAM